MKTILRILVILLVASIVAGAFSLVVNHTSIASGLSGGGTPRLAMTDGDNQTTTRPMADLEAEGGGRESASVAGGLAGVLATLAKLTSITALVLFAQKVASLLGNRRPHLA
jgi:hypothetical protein